MQFKDIIGQDNIKARLTASVDDGRISHAQLFVGKNGYGTFSLALAYAQYIFCTNRQNGDACGVCPSCHKIQKTIHPDILFIYPSVGGDKSSGTLNKVWSTMLSRSNYFTIDDWQDSIPDLNNSIPIIPVSEAEKIIQFVNRKAFESQYKVVLIWMPERMNLEAANKLLKVLEEPFADTFFLLVSENPDLLLPTIQSRLQRVNVHPIATQEISQFLQKQKGIDVARADKYAKIAQGDLRVALHLLNENETAIFNQEQFVALMRLCWERKMLPVNKWVDQIAKIGREKQKSFLNHSLRMLRENFMRNFGREELIYMSEREEQFSDKFSPYVNEGNIIPLCDEFEKAYADIQANGNPKYIFTDLCIKVMQNIRPSNVK